MSLTRLGRLQKAPEFFLTYDAMSLPRDDRRTFLRKAFVAASAASIVAAAPRAFAQAGAVGDPAILHLPAHSKGLGQPVAARPYGLPSKYEENLQRRESPGLTRVGAASVSFAPLQGFFGIITPSGLHFERHHQGWWDIDPSQHRLMLNGLVREPRVFTMEIGRAHV